MMEYMESRFKKLISILDRLTLLNEKKQVYIWMNDWKKDRPDLKWPPRQNHPQQL